MSGACKNSWLFHITKFKPIKESRPQPALPHLDNQPLTSSFPLLDRQDNLLLSQIHSWLCVPPKVSTTWGYRAIYYISWRNNLLLSRSQQVGSWHLILLLFYIKTGTLPFLPSRKPHPLGCGSWLQADQVKVLRPALQDDFEITGWIYLDRLMHINKKELNDEN